LIVFSGIFSLSYYKISILINLSKYYNSPYAVFHVYFFPNRIHTPSMTISTILGGLFIVLSKVNPYLSIFSTSFNALSNSGITFDNSA